MLMPDNAWLEIQKSLEKLLRDPTMTRFHPAIEQIKYWTSVSSLGYTPEVFLAFIELIRQMGEDVNRGKPVNMVLDQAVSRTGAYNQPNWDVDKVFQSNGDIFYYAIGNWREKIELD